MDPARDFSLLCFLNWCQQQVARFTMQPADHALYGRLTSDYSMGHMPYEEFEDEMEMLLHEYPDLRVWWQVHHAEVTGMMRMVDNPLVGYPFVLCVMLNCLLLFGDHLWEYYHNGDKSYINA